MYKKEKLKDVATALGGIDKLLQDLGSQCMIGFGKDFGIGEAAAQVRQACSDVIVTIEQFPEGQ